MPAYSTHYIFAKELKDTIENQVDFKLDEAAYYIGTQGPDIFFDHRIMPWMLGKSLRKTGSKLHRAKPSEIFENMREYISKSNQIEIAKSYAAGFILHYVLDRNCHPYVYFLQNKMTDEFKKLNSHTAHNIIEFSMDTYLLSKRMNIKRPHLFDTADTLNFSNLELEELGKMISYITNAVTKSNITPNDAITAIKDIKYIQKLTTDKTGRKEKIVKIIDDLCAPFLKNFKFSALMRPKDLENAKKYGNIERKIWTSPYDKIKRSKSFEDLFELSKIDALNMINQFFLGEDTYKITQNKSFLTGVEVK